MNDYSRETLKQIRQSQEFKDLKAKIINNPDNYHVYHEGINGTLPLAIGRASRMLYTMGFATLVQRKSYTPNSVNMPSTFQYLIKKNSDSLVEAMCPECGKEKELSIGVCPDCWKDIKEEKNSE